MSAPAIRAPERRAWSAVAVDAIAVLALCAVGVIGFGSVFSGGHLPAGLGGAALGVALALGSARWRVGLLPTIAAGLILYLLFGGALALRDSTVAGVIPTVDTIRELLLGVVTSWKTLLTAPTPVDGFVPVLVVPYLSSLVAASVATSIALRTKRPAWALLPPALLLVTAIAFGTTAPAAGFAPVGQGVVFAGVATAWLAWRRAGAVAGGADGRGPAVSQRRIASRAVTTRRILTAAGMLVVAAVAGAAASPVLAPDTPRQVIREAIEPPLDLRDYASPLSKFRAFVRDVGSDTLFTVDGLPEGARIRLATVDAYDGVVYDVSGDGSAGSGRFTRVEGPIDSSRALVGDGATEAELTITIGELTGVWLPDAGYLEGITFAGERAETLGDTLHYNRQTGVGIVTAGLATGDSYTIDTLLPRTFSDEQLATRLPVSIALPEDSGVPEVVAGVAAETIVDATTPLAQLRALESTLATTGFFSHGLEGEAVSRAGHSAGRIQSLLGGEQMVGDDEQYAVAMALMARELGLPARVVMGFYPAAGTDGSGTFQATGDDLHAWVEVAFDRAGWVTFDPTPPENQIPQEQAPKPQSKPRAQVLQPPPAPQKPVELPPDSLPDDLPDDEKDEPEPLWLTVLAWAGGALLALLVLLAPAVVIAVAKLRRRRRRRRAAEGADRLTGGWSEVVDRATDLGTRAPAGSTRRESAVLLARSFGGVDTTTLADRADAGVFGPVRPSDSEVDAYWRDVETALGAMGATVSRRRRLRALVSLASLRAGRAATPRRRAPRQPAPPQLAAPQPAAPQSAAPPPAPPQSAQEARPDEGDRR